MPYTSFKQQQCGKDLGQLRTTSHATGWLFPSSSSLPSSAGGGDGGSLVSLTGTAVQNEEEVVGNLVSFLYMNRVVGSQFQMHFRNAHPHT